MARVYVLGAGASCFAGYPLAPKLWSFARDRSLGDSTANERQQDLVDALNRIFERFPPDVYDEPNLEELFTLLDLSILMPSILELNHIDWTLRRLDVAAMIADAFLNYQSDLQSVVYAGQRPVGDLEVNPSRVRQVLDAWTMRIQPGDVIISFNWDLMHEVALWKAKRWSYADGYGFTCADSGGAPHSDVEFLKLHGSINWTQQDHTDTAPDVVHKGDFFTGALDGPSVYAKEAGQRDQGRKLIIPTYLKAVSSNALLARLWSKAGDALRRAHEIIVIGYRLNRADSAAHQLFNSSLLANTHRPSVRVVNPKGANGDNWDDLCTVVGYPRPVRTHTAFETWVLEEPLPTGLEADAQP